MRRKGGNRKPRVTYYNAPPGLGHAKASVKTMARLAREGAHTYEIRNLATRITRNVPSKDVRGELAAIYTWVRDNIRYRFDPVELEWIQAPLRTIKEGAGDCDDMATLIASLAQSLGHKTRYRTVGPTHQRQEHVYAEAWDGATWVTLDPVLEKRQPTAAPRPHDLGNFAHSAHGTKHVYDDGGSMLGFVPTAQEKELWIFTPWQNPQMAAEPYQPDLRYRSDSTTGGPPRAYVTARPGEIDTSKMDGLGCVPYYAPNLGGWGFLKKIGSVVGSAASTLAPLAAVIPGIGLPIAGALAAGGAVLKAVTKDGKKVKATPQQLATLPRLAASAPRTRQPLQLTPQGFPAPTQSSPASLAPLLATVTRLADRSISEIARLARGEQRGRHQRRALVARERITSRAKRPRLKRVWDARSKKFVMVAQLGAIKPSFSISLLGAADPAMAASAGAAIARVRAFVARAGQPPQIALTQVQDFQRASNATTAERLREDGLWGPNTRAAAAYYADKPIDTLPPVARPYQRYAVSWTPPTTAPATAPATTPRRKRRPRKAPAKAPAAVKRAATRPARTQTQAASDRTTAQRAVMAVRVFIARDPQHRSPQVPLPAVRVFQAVSNSAHVDGLYGPATRASLARVLRVAPSSLPPVSPAFTRRTVTPITPKEPAKPPGETNAQRRARLVDAQTVTSTGQEGGETNAQRRARLVSAERAKAARIEAARLAALELARNTDASKQAELLKAAEEAARLAEQTREPAKKRRKKIKIHAAETVELTDAPTQASADGGNKWLWLAAAYYLSRRAA